MNAYNHDSAWQAAPEGAAFDAAVASKPVGLKPILFLDFEASSLSANSWPIEIGMAWIEGGRVQVKSTVIAPRPDWSLAAWSEASERVHGIPFTEVEAGVPADIVAAETDWLAGFDVVSDNPAWDQLWLDRLRTGRAPYVSLLDMRTEVHRRLSCRAVDEFSRRHFQGVMTHRAGADAERLARAWFAAGHYGLAA